MIEYRENHPIPMEQLLILYKDWTAYVKHPEKMAKLLPGSLWHISAWDGEKAVGFLRTVGDDCTILYIQDLMVLPEYQRQGIAKELIERTLKRFRHIRQIVLLTDDNEEVKAFYRACGMKLAEEYNCRCFVHFNLDR